MFGEIYRGINLTKIIGGLQRTLNFANQLIPLYKETKPLLNNARNTFNTIKKWSYNNIEKIPDNKNIKDIKEKINTLKSINLNNPTFFQ
jgi:hypothetical protein